MKNSRAKSVSVDNKGRGRMKSQTVQVDERGTEPRTGQGYRQNGVSKKGLSSKKGKLWCFLLRVSTLSVDINI